MQRAVIVAAAAGAPDGLAVDRHPLALDLTRQGLCPSRKTALKRVRVDQHEDPPERIVRGNTVWQGQEGLQPSLLAAPVEFDVLPAFRAGDDRAHRDYENVDQPMIALACHPRIGEPVEARWQIFNHAARLPSPRTGNGRHHPQSATSPTFMREPWPDHGLENHPRQHRRQHRAGGDHQASGRQALRRQRLYRSEPVQDTLAARPAPHYWYPPEHAELPDAPG